MEVPKSLSTSATSPLVTGSASALDTDVNKAELKKDWAAAASETPKPSSSMNIRFASSYRLSMTFLLSVACLRLFPDYSLVIQSGYGLSRKRRSYLCRLDNVKDSGQQPKLKQKDIDAIREEMKEMIEADLPLTSIWMSHSALEKQLISQNSLYTLKLIRTLNEEQYRVIALFVKKKSDLSVTSEMPTTDTLSPTDTLSSETSGYVTIPFPSQAWMSLTDVRALSASSLRDVSLAGTGIADPKDYDMYVTLQHREFLPSVGLLKYFELFLAHNPEDGEMKPKKKAKAPTILRRTSILTEDEEIEELKREMRERDEFFVLAFADKDEPTVKIEYPNPAYSLQLLYRKGFRLGSILGLQCVGDINQRILTGKGKELVLLSEAYHNQQIVNMAQQIFDAQQERGVKFVLISGPSSSGKTTFASKLGMQLKLLGMRPASLQLDMYFKSGDDPSYPRDTDGSLNFECIDAMRLDLLNDHLSQLLKGSTITEPFFDFTTGSFDDSKATRRVSLDPDCGILIMEGIFCLNPRLTSSIEGSKYSIFVCPQFFCNLDNLNFLSNQVVRVIRRISRDNQHRGRTAAMSLSKWAQVHRGEELNMFPYLGSADAVFNSSLVYELPVLHAFSKSLLQTVMPDSLYYKDAKTLRHFCNSFVPMPDSDVPKTSLLMEFIGSSIFDEVSL